MKFKKRTLFTVLLLLPAVFAQAQTPPPTYTGGEEMTLPRWGIKTNLLYDATATINLGVEFRTGAKTSLDLSGNYNAWEFSNDRKWKHWLIQPEFRLWTKETFDGHFFGLHALHSLYNISGLPHGPFTEYMRDHRFEGWLAGAGVSYGHRWNFSHRWAMEATVGVGYVYKDYDIFECGECGELLDSKTKHYFGPTKVGLNLIYSFGGKPATPPVPVYVAPPAPKPEPVVIYEPSLTVSFVVPEAEAVKTRSESGSAYLDFAVGRWEIVAGFRDNAAELQKIHSTIELVLNNPDASLIGITITGNASPEGSYASNMALSERRAQALRNWIGSAYGLPNNQFNVSGAGEDWATLETLAAASQMAEKHRVLEIVRGSADFDARERQLRSLGAAYRTLLSEYYPRLRRSDYRIGYTVVPFTVERGKEVMRTRPGDLSLNEMFLIANTYEPGGDAFNEVFETAARVFPDSDTANINAAATALERRDAVSAARYLDRVKERGAAYWNNMGVLSWLRGDRQRAAEYFANAGASARANAAEMEKHLRSIGGR